MCEILKYYQSENKTAAFLEALKAQMPFQNEAQFQHALAMLLDEDIKKNGKPYRILLEVWTGGKISEKSQSKTANDCYTDIVLLDAEQKEYLAIELKYKTAALTFENEYGEVRLKQQGANDEGCYDYLRDIQRIQNLILGECGGGNLNRCKCVGGYAIFITNEKQYWEYRREKMDGKNGYFEFCIGDDSAIKWEMLNWAKGRRELDENNSRHDPIQLDKALVHGETFMWEPYYMCDKGDGAKEFRCLCLEIGGQRS